jgi:hypothetical protein
MEIRRINWDLKENSMSGMIRTLLIEQKAIHDGQIEKLINERDDARRELCKVLAMNPLADGTDSSNPIFHSVVRGWDCFKEDGK